MNDAKMTAAMKLVVAVCAVLLLWNAAPSPRWAASLEIASFRLALSSDGGTVHLRTEASGSGQSRPLLGLRWR